MDGVNKDMWSGVNAVITSIDYKLVNDRKIGYRAVIEVTVSVEERTETVMVTGIDGLPHTQLKLGLLQVNKTVECKEDRFVIKEDLAVTAGKPNIREILHTHITITNKDAKVAAGKVNISGELMVSTLYKTDDTENELEFIEHELPFNGAIDVDAALDGMVCDVALRVLDQYVQARPNEDGEDRVIETEVSVGASLKVTNQCDITVLEDAYCINKTLEYNKKTVSFPKLICRNKNQNPVKEIVKLDANCPNILQVFRVSGRVQHDETRVSDDRVTVEGVVYTDILYIAGSDDSPLYNHKTMIPYKQTIETKGARDGMDVTVEVNIDHTAFGMLSEKEVEVRFLLSCNATVVDNTTADVITDVEFLEIDKTVLDKMAGMVIYVVQPGDSLWSIAKKYNAGLDDLMELNEMDDPNRIGVGQRLVIVKKVYGE
jgi:LysM repeat protein